MDAIEQRLETTGDLGGGARRRHRGLAECLTDAEHPQQRSVGLLQGHGAPASMRFAEARGRLRLVRVRPFERAHPLENRRAGQLTVLAAGLELGVEQANAGEVPNESLRERDVGLETGVGRPHGP
jgi:hypothetical protein